MIPNFVDSNHQRAHKCVHTHTQHTAASEAVVNIPESLCLCVYLAREDRNIPGIWWIGWRRQSKRFPFTLRHPGLVGCANDLQYLSGRFSKLSCSDTSPCMKKEVYLNLWPNLMCGVIRCNRLKPQEVSETMLFRFALITCYMEPGHQVLNIHVIYYQNRLETCSNERSSLTCNCMSHGLR